MIFFKFLVEPTRLPVTLSGFLFFIKPPRWSLSNYHVNVNLLSQIKPPEPTKADSLALISDTDEFLSPPHSVIRSLGESSEVVT